VAKSFELFFCVCKIEKLREKNKINLIETGRSKRERLI
jgi:hypothetical protein